MPPGLLVVGILAVMAAEATVMVVEAATRVRAVVRVRVSGPMVVGRCVPLRVIAIRRATAAEAQAGPEPREEAGLSGAPAPWSVDRRFFLRFFFLPTSSPDIRCPEDDADNNRALLFL